MQFTKLGFENLKKEYADFLEKRKDAVMHVVRAREMGDLSENGYYKASKQKLGFIDGQLRRLKYMIKQAEVREHTSSEIVEIGGTVSIESNGKRTTYEMVGGYESNPLEGKLSILSPLGKALLGKKRGEIITVTAPKGQTSYTILTIE